MADCKPWSQALVNDSSLHFHFVSTASGILTPRPPSHLNASLFIQAGLPQNGTVALVVSIWNSSKFSTLDLLALSVVVKTERWMCSSHIQGTVSSRHVFGVTNQRN